MITAPASAFYPASWKAVVEELELVTRKLGGWEGAEETGLICSPAVTPTTKPSTSSVQETQGGLKKHSESTHSERRTGWQKKRHYGLGHLQLHERIYRDLDELHQEMLALVGRGFSAAPDENREPRRTYKEFVVARRGDCWAVLWFEAEEDEDEAVARGDDLP